MLFYVFDVSLSNVESELRKSCTETKYHQPCCVAIKVFCTVCIVTLSLNKLIYRETTLHPVNSLLYKVSRDGQALTHCQKNLSSKSVLICFYG